MVPILKPTKDTEEIDRLFEDDIVVQKDRKPLMFDEKLKKSFEEVRRTMKEENDEENQRQAYPT